MSKGQAARTSLCCSEEREEGDLPAWTWWNWRPRDRSASIGSEGTWSELTAHIQAHGQTRMQTRYTCVCLCTQSHIQHVHTTQEHILISQGLYQGRNVDS